ncbi:flagellar biosynthetic protein FliO [Idiomarina sp. A28L]|uniref:flagellar biosynthetic protein FliO n=1 Tax=Idiomarina sp. A28L TaxID=1036674 RepID=UPI0002138C06|nr:flagellar biosynthetic protein FliO [Idiomarina sp. A28L]EGN75986.1 flagellar biosynthetic protein FliO [Idiomarina sp. A28L]
MITNTSTAVSTPAGTDVVSSLTLLGKVSGSLILVILIIIVCAWLFRRIGSSWLPSTTNKIRVVTSANLGGKERIVVVDVEGKRLVLGVAPGSVNHLTELPIPETTETDKEPAESEQANVNPILSPFANLLKSKQNATQNHKGGKE